MGLLAGAAMLDLPPGVDEETMMEMAITLLPPGVDEETMMEMAITLSLQEQQQGQAANVCHS